MPFQCPCGAQTEEAAWVVKTERGKSRYGFAETPNPIVVTTNTCPSCGRYEAWAAERRPEEQK